MKKLIWYFIIPAGLFLLATEVAQANETEQEKKQITQNVRPGFTDLNSDGICDFYDGKRPGQGLGPGNGQGAGRATGKGLCYASGVNSNRQQNFDGNGNGRKTGNGKQLRNGSGGNCFVRLK